MITARPNESKVKSENNSKKSMGFDNRSNNRAFYEDGEEDYLEKEGKNYKSTGQSKSKIPPDTPFDKYETMKRLEREKKALQKKMLDEEYSKHKSPMKQKKNSKTNWTKYYEKGLIDEDDYLF